MRHRACACVPVRASKGTNYCFLRLLCHPFPLLANRKARTGLDELAIRRAHGHEQGGWQQRPTSSRSLARSRLNGQESPTTHPCRQTRASGKRRTTPCHPRGTAPRRHAREDGKRVQSRGARAHAVHERLIRLALIRLGPPDAALVVVIAHSRADLRAVPSGSAKPTGATQRGAGHDSAPRRSPGTPSSPRGGCSRTRPHRPRSRIASSFCRRT